MSSYHRDASAGTTDLKHGPATYWYASGELYSSGSFADDLLTGLWATFWENGTLYEIGRWKKGGPDSAFCLWTKDGGPKSCDCYQDGLSAVPPAAAECFSKCGTKCGP